MTAGIKSRLLKMILKKLRSYDFDTSEEKKDCQIYEFLFSAPVKNSIKNHQLFQNILISNFMFTPLEPSLNSQTFLKLKDFKINGKIHTPGQKDKVTFASLS